MSNPFDETDPPTVARRLSPRARTALSAQGSAAFDDDDDPTVALHQRPQPVAEPEGGGNSSLQGAARIVQQLEAVPERTLVRIAAPLLLMVAQLRNSVERADVPALRRQVVEEMDRFQQVAQKAGIDAGDIIAARYILCSVIDETVLMTPWGSRSEWSANSLLNQYHNETWGGEKVFQILDRVRGNPDAKIQILILLHTCLMLGFEGRYRVLERGRDQLEELRTDLSRLIKRHSKIKPDETLSKDAQGERHGKRLNTFVPLWMVAVGVFCVLIIVSTYVEFMLSGALGPVMSKIETLTAG